ncbi:MAG: RsmD family RNA methyltransferase [Candidatus Zixiibacteriota bacterium]|nr:MAG: RsmD family RNA methyltransferase [candidate division Zixibacteria bacterium]
MAKRKPTYHRFRVVAGDLKGKIISAPDLGVTRPPLTRLRKAIFDFLNPYIQHRSYLDLFSGTGSYLFEAVSRGAAMAVGVEMEPVLADAINDQARECGVQDRLVCLCDDVFDAIPKLKTQQKTFDIIMIAPPQYKGMIDETLRSIKEDDVTGEDTLIICQHDTSETKKIDFLDYQIWQRRKYGNTTFTILK